MSQTPYPSPMPAAAGQGPRSERQYSYFSAMVLSVYSKSLWRDVGRNWRGIGILYMLLLLAITWLVTTIQMNRGVMEFTDSIAPRLIKDVPAITITKGIVSIDEPEPYSIYEMNSKRAVVVIDTTGETTTLPPGAVALLTRDSVIARDGNGMRVHKLPPNLSCRIDQTVIKGWLATLRTWFFPCMFALVMIVGFAWRVILMLVGGGIGMLFASGFKAPISYAAAVRLSAIAMTPGILLSTILGLTRLPGLGCSGTFLGIGLFVLILAFAVKANAPEKEGYVGGFPVMPPPSPLPPPPVPPVPPVPPLTGM